MIESIPFVNSIFEQPWWLDAVAPGEWEAIEIVKDDRVVARLPYVKKKKMGFRLIGMPDYTQTLGYWIDESGAKNARKFAREKDLVSELINRLPKDYCIDLSLDHTCDYLFPFKWNGFNLQMVYSYRLEDIHDINALWKNLGGNIRREIKKSQKVLLVEDDHSISDLILMQEKTFARQGRKYSIEKELLFRLDSALVEHKARKLFCAVDSAKRIHAAAYFVYDLNCCYYLMGGGDPELRNSGAASLLLWEGIKFASSVSKSFDFEGSMIESIERFFRAFGGTPTPYWRVTKINLALSIEDYLKPKIKKIIGWQ